MSEFIQQLDKRTPAVEYELVDVTFDSADTDVEIKTGLRPLNPEALHVQVLNASGPPLIYRDTSASRVKWSAGLIRLRSAIAGLKATLLLTIPSRDFVLIDGGSKVIAKGLLPASIAYKDVANVFSENQTIERNLAAWAAKHSGSAYTRFASFSASGGHISQNMYFDGSAWNLDDTTLRGLGLSMGPGGSDPGWAFFAATAGTNPRTTTEVLRILATGGIRFPANQVASAGANDLDDYEEGTWVPVIGGDGGQSGQTYNIQTGFYVKVGKLVFAQGFAQLSNKGTITGSAGINNFPFQSEGGGNQFHGGVVAQAHGLATNWVSVNFHLTPGSAFGYLQGRTAASTGITTLVSSDIGNTTQIMVACVYRTSN
jgi:hypothetical protein